MGFELGKIEPDKLSVDDILKGIDSGEIVPGRKDTRTTELTDGIVGSYNKKEGTLTFDHNGVRAKVTIHQGRVTAASLIDMHSDNVVYDGRILEGRTRYIQTLLDEGQLLLPE